MTHMSYLVAYSSKSTQWGVDYEPWVEVISICHFVLPRVHSGEDYFNFIKEELHGAVTSYRDKKVF